MYKKASFSVSSLLILCTPLKASNSHIENPKKLQEEQTNWTSMFSLPQPTIDEHFRSVKEQIEHRWDLLAGNYSFPAYFPGREEASLIEEFYQFSNLRVQLWLQNSPYFPRQSNYFFKVAQEILLKNRFRQPNCITFEHSATDSSYNCTSLQIGKRRFFALEGPLEEHVPYFFRLLANWNVAFLVCLTDEIDKETDAPKCYPYWKDRILVKENRQFLQIPTPGPYEKPSFTWNTKDLPYLFWPEWKDHQGMEPELLVNAVNHVRAKVGAEEIIAVHCSAGVGRTGTFLAAVCLLDAIDAQIAAGSSIEALEINISKLFLYLNFHRPWLVAKPAQYITLYKTVEWYINHCL